MPRARLHVRAIVFGLAIFAAGSLAGAALMAFWASRASGLFLQMTRLSFATEQEMSLRRAWRENNLAAALKHAACQVEADGDPHAFDPVRFQWHLSFPLFGAAVTERTRWNQAKGTTVEAIAHAELATVWERLGHAENAQREFSEATRITGITDKERLRKMAIASLDQPTPGVRRQSPDRE